jgi:hypothetical protein
LKSNKQNQIMIFVASSDAFWIQARRNGQGWLGSLWPRGQTWLLLLWR